jgi:hypothetical protein
VELSQARKSTVASGGTFAAAAAEMKPYLPFQGLHSLLSQAQFGSKLLHSTILGCCHLLQLLYGGLTLLDLTSAAQARKKIMVCQGPALYVCSTSEV